MTGMNRVRAIIRDCRGAVAVEFAAIAIPLMIMLVGSIEVSRFVWTRLALQDAATTGARCLGLRLPPCFVDGSISTSGVTGFVQDQATGWGIGLPGATVSPTESAICNGTAGFAQIAIRHEVTSVLAVLPAAWISVEACFPLLPEP